MNVAGPLGREISLLSELEPGIGRTHEQRDHGPAQGSVDGKTGMVDVAVLDQVRTLSHRVDAIEPNPRVPAPRERRRLDPFRPRFRKSHEPTLEHENDSDGKHDR